MTYAKTKAINNKSNLAGLSENDLFEKAIEDEYIAIEEYERLLAQCDNPLEMEIYEEIKKDEENHIRLLNKIKKGEVTKNTLKEVG